MNVTDRQTDGRTDTTRRHVPHLCIASRGNNNNNNNNNNNTVVHLGDTKAVLCGTMPGR